MSASNGPKDPAPVSAADALRRLRDGNRRFVQGVRSVDSLLVGSVEFAVAAYHTALVVVMGHSRCGVIASMIDGVTAERAVSPNVVAIFDHARPAIDEVLRSPLARPGADRAIVIAAATRANVRWSTARLREGSELIAARVQQGAVLVVGAEYSLETGEVDFFDGVPT